MTQKQFNADYKKYISNWQVQTLTDRRQSYNSMMESYYCNGMITDKQRQTWGHPLFLIANKNKINCSAY